MSRIAGAASGACAVVVAYAGGAAWPLVAAAALLYAGAYSARGGWRLLGVVMAPLVLAAGLTAPRLDPIALAVGSAVALLAIGPLVGELGPPARVGRTLLLVATAAAVPPALMLLPAARVAFASDIGPGALILALAAGALIAAAAGAMPRARA